MLTEWWSKVTESPYRYAIARRTAGRMLSVAYVAVGVFMAVSRMIEVRGEWSGVAAQLALGLVACVAGVLSWFAQWEKAPRWTMVGAALVCSDAFVFIYNAHASEPFRYSVFLFLFSVWLGLTQRQGTGFWVLILTAVPYLVSNSAVTNDALKSAGYALPAAVLMSESLAFISHRLADAHYRLTHLAYHDSLTGLFNRAYFYDCLHDVLRNTDSQDRLALILIVDLNDFKSVNDGFGHQAGDALLTQTARALENSTLGYGVWARLGGDEFGCVIASLGAREAAYRFVRMIKTALETPIRIENVMFRVGISIGFSVAPFDGVTASDVMRAADEAVYLDKTAVGSVPTHPVFL